MSKITNVGLIDDRKNRTMGPWLIWHEIDGGICHEIRQISS